MKYLNERVSMYMHAYTLYSAVRPYGCSVVMGTWSDYEGPQMTLVDPSGVSFVSIDLMIDTLGKTGKLQILSL